MFPYLARLVHEWDIGQTRYLFIGCHATGVEGETVGIESDRFGIALPHLTNCQWVGM